MTNHTNDGAGSPVLTPSDKRAHEIVRTIMASGGQISNDGHLGNPFKSTPKTKKPPAAAKEPASTQFMLSDLANDRAKEAARVIPDENAVERYNAGDWVRWWATKYERELGVVWSIVYASQGVAFTKIGAYFDRNGLSKNLWIHRFLTWAFSKREAIIDKTGFFTPTHIIRVLNEFYSLEVVPALAERTTEDGSASESLDNSLADEIRQAYEGGAPMTALLRKYGFPLTATFLVKHAGLDERLVVRNTEALIEKWLDSGSASRADVKLACQISIANSPYPDTFVLTNWREKSEALIAQITDEVWYLPSDYPGVPRSRILAVGIAAVSASGATS